MIIGSGFGGAVSALRLAEKGYSVAVLETGKHWRAQDFARTNWNIRRYLWAPLLRCFGPQRITWLRGLMLLHGTGVGGGSLIYAGTLMKPRPEVFTDSAWPIALSYESLAPHYARAERMLGVARNPRLFPSEIALQNLGQTLGVADTFHPTEVGVYFGDSGKTVPDPCFEGRGPNRTGCTFCGACMVGCRVGAKNTLDRNYLHLAQNHGAKIHAELSADRIVRTSEGFRVETRRSTSWIPGMRGPTFRATRVIVAAGVLGTLKLLLLNRDVYGTLPKISKNLGNAVRTNGESLLGATRVAEGPDFSRGIAIGAAIHPDSHTKIEAVKYPSGSGFMRLLAVPLTGPGNRLVRPLKLLGRCLWKIADLVRLWSARNWAVRSVILLVMQSSDTRMRLGLRGKRLTRLPGGSTIPTYMPVAQAAAETLAAQIHGVPQNILPEVLLATPASAHILGGCVMADHADRGVVDSNHELNDEPGIYICDGSVIPGNLGVNPSLTIAALAERFVAQFPVR